MPFQGYTGTYVTLAQSYEAYKSTVCGQKAVWEIRNKPTVLNG